ncbi:MAG: hypothetical protein HUJ25_00005 [Crocinitomicaceae bacterium]|nr:hypothetical protein [Crocinitomicaceae bacterium]
MTISRSQNLVPNPSFEDTVYCPAGTFDLGSMNNWTDASDGSPDFFHSCNGTTAGVPNNVFGEQLAHTGSAYAGISVYDTLDTWSYREYIQVELIPPLQASQTYFVSLYVSLAGGNIDYAIQELGIYFSSSLINETTDTTLNFVPQIENDAGVITDTINWTEINGSFIASGGEQFLIIGNFNRKQNSTAQQVKNTGAAYSYYYIDDVCVSTDSLTCTEFTSIGEEQSSSSKKLIKIVDLLGRESEVVPNKILIYIYSDGSTEKVILQE